MKATNFIKSIIVGLPIGVTFLDLVGYVARVDGISMQPALNPDKATADYVFLNRWAVRSLDIKRGDIISLISPKDPSLKIIKRVVAVQGDVVATLGYKREVVRIPEGHCWVEGDHTGHSMDSNNFGPVSLGLITAKASCIVWPPSRWQYIKSHLPESRVPLNIAARTLSRISQIFVSVNTKMRAISLVDRLEFDFTSNVLRKGITLGDIDNDGCNELVVGGENGDVTIFKGKEKWLTLTGLGFVSCVAVGDILNQKKNSLVIITADGWCHIYNCTLQPFSLSDSSDTQPDEKNDEGFEQVDGQIFSSESIESERSTSSDSVATSSQDKEKNVLKRVHLQRIPANTKDILLGDIDGDGAIEMVLGLTDRVVRSYRWFESSSAQSTDLSQSQEMFETVSGKLVGLSKWECAKQIGSVTLHHSKDGTPSLLVAQPGGTFMRIICEPEEVVAQSMEAAMEQSDSGSENLVGSKIDYQFLGISRMRNQNISTEILGDLNTKPCEEDPESDGSEVPNSASASTTTTATSSCSNTSSSSRSEGSFKNPAKIKIRGKPYAVATLDGTIMLVHEEIILWAIAVDHQIFALTKLDVTGNGTDDIIACSWDGQTYILDQNKNSVRFQLDESVQAFECGYYNVTADSPPVTCFVYVTFRNKIYLYYDIPLKEMICKRYEPDLSQLRDIIQDEYADEGKIDRKSKKQLVEYLLYGVESSYSTLCK